MEIFETQEQNYTVVTVQGRIDSYTAPQLTEVLRAITLRGIFTIILDLHDVVYISSAGLRVLIDILKICKKSKNGELILVNVPARVNETLGLAGFAPLFRIFPDVQSALKQN